jgi:thiol:disulfide interchange protein DsbC
LKLEAQVLPIHKLLVPVVASLALAGAVRAAPQATQPSAKPDLRAEIARRLEIKVDDVRPSPVAGLYEVSSGAEVGYVSADGRFYLDGDVFDMSSKENLTEDRRKQGRLALLAGVSDADAIVFAPKTAARHTVTVFTDVDCVHCRRMHGEMAELNRLGIRVRYLMFPRGGPGSDSWRKAEAVWCSGDRKEALTRAKRGETLDADRGAVRARSAARHHRDAGNHHGSGRVSCGVCDGRLSRYLSLGSRGGCRFAVRFSAREAAACRARPSTHPRPPAVPSAA